MNASHFLFCEFEIIISYEQKTMDEREQSRLDREFIQDLLDDDTQTISLNFSGRRTAVVEILERILSGDCSTKAGPTKVQLLKLQQLVAGEFISTSAYKKEAIVTELLQNR